MFDHVLIRSTPALFAQTIKMYETALAPLGITKLKEIPSVAAGFGEKAPDLWLFSGENVNPAHFALRAKDRETVRKFHEAAIQAGATDNGAPGIRAQLSPTYYAAFVKDLGGNNLEVVCHVPEE